MSEYDNPPTSASPDKLVELCGILREGEINRADAPVDELSFSKSVLRDVIFYGKKMGFITEEDDTLTATDIGVEITYTQSGTKRHSDIFSQGVLNYPLYSDLLIQLVDEEEDTINDTGYILRDACIRDLRIDFGFDLKEDTLRKGTNVFLKTLQSAGLGEYSPRGKPSGLEISDGFWSDIEDLFDDSSASKSRDLESGEGALDPENLHGNNGGDRNTIGNNRNSNITQQNSNVSYEVSIQIQLDGNEDPENVHNIIDAVKSGLENTSERSTDTVEKPDTNEVDESRNGKTDDQVGITDFDSSQD